MANRKHRCDVFPHDTIQAIEFAGVVEVLIETTGAANVMLTPEAALAFAADLVAAAEKAASEAA